MKLHATVTVGWCDQSSSAPQQHADMPRSDARTRGAYVTLQGLSMLMVGYDAVGI